MRAQYDRRQRLSKLTEITSDISGDDITTRNDALVAEFLYWATNTIINLSQQVDQLQLRFDHLNLDTSTIPTYTEDAGQ